MPASQFAQSHADFRAMARLPSYRAPRACDVLNPPPFEPPLGPRMCAEERRLLDAVIAAPDDDVPRWAMAEWLIANGDEERGAFILAQLKSYSPLPRFGGEGPGVRGWASPRLPFAPTHSLTPLTQPSRPRSGERATPRTRSPPGVPAILSGDAASSKRCRSPAALSSRSAPRSSSMTPLRDVRLVAIQPFLAELAACPHLAKLDSLDLRGNHIGDEGLKIIAPSVSHLMTLNLSANSLTPGSDARLASLRLRGVDVKCDANPLSRAA